MIRNCNSPEALSNARLPALSASTATDNLGLRWPFSWVFIDISHDRREYGLCVPLAHVRHSATLQASPSHWPRLFLETIQCQP